VPFTDDVGMFGAVNTTQLFIWRRRYRNRVQDVSGVAGPELLPVKITDERASEPTPPPPVGDARIETELPNGCRIRVEPSIDVKALRRIVDMLERR